MRSIRHKNAKGQALVMITLSLLGMTGLMGLAVDLGWSYFVKKQAQAAADGAALAAAQEAMATVRKAGLQPTGLTACDSVAGVDCQATPVSCKSIGSTSNLNNGCLYAKANGFDYSTTDSRQDVRIQANVTSPPPSAPGVNTVVYWVTVRTVQTVPQLFSAVLGNTLGTVSASATAAIVGSVLPGSFYGMNQRGDCLADGSHCGLDVDVAGSGGGNCGTFGNAKLCAPAGLVLASSCNGAGSGCDSYSGTTHGNASVKGSSLTVMQGGAVNGDWTPATPTFSSNPKTFQDPTQGLPQPPLQSSAPIGSCGYPFGVIPTNVQMLGPYQYYSYHTDKFGNKIVDGAPISLPSGVTFSKSIVGCPGGLTAIYSPGADQTSALPSYIFWGGLNINSGGATFGPGQYVMAGTLSSGTVLSLDGPITGDSNTGTMFIFTDDSYPGLQPTATSAGQISNIPGTMPSLSQGTLDFKHPDVTLTGLVNSANSSSSLPPAMDAYSGIAWWQDRRNSTVEYNKDYANDYPYLKNPACTDCSGDDGSVVNCAGCAHVQTAAELAENHVTSTSPDVTLQHGNGTLNIQGVWYQPRGAALIMDSGTVHLDGPNGTQVPLQIITGSLVQTTGGGNAAVLLKGPTNPLILYHTALIQ